MKECDAAMVGRKKERPCWEAKEEGNRAPWKGEEGWLQLKGKFLFCSQSKAQGGFTKTLESFFIYIHRPYILDLSRK